jgi:anti-sigma B factor antagonist
MTELEGTRLTVAVHRVGHRAVIEATGDIDMAAGPAFAAAAEEVVRSGALEVWVDLGPTRFMDSTGLKILLRLRRRLVALRRRLAIVCPRGPVHRVFEIAGLDRELVIHPTLSAAQRQA